MGYYTITSSSNPRTLKRQKDKMDNKTCKGCFLIIDSSASHCPSCGKSQKSGFNNFMFSLVFILLLLCGIFGTTEKGDKTPPQASAITQTAIITPPTTTAVPNISETPIIATPDAEHGWIKVQPGLWARRTDNRSDCFEMGTGIEYCAGQPVEYYSTNGRWIVAWENSWSKTREEIIPGEANLVYVPSDATNIHWEWGVPGCDSLFIEECLGN